MTTLTVKVQVNQFAKRLSPKAIESVNLKSPVSVIVVRGHIALPQILVKLLENLIVISSSYGFSLHYFFPSYLWNQS